MGTATAEQDFVQTPSQFFSYKDRLEKELAKSLLGFGEKTALRDACEYALMGSGKRMRPLIVLLIGEAIGKGLPLYESALCVEFFHTASLIVDDLPCMDDEEERRNRPALHKVFGEATALLASYSLLCAAFGKIQENGTLFKQALAPESCFAEQHTLIAIEHATRLAGILGATGGQYADLFTTVLSLDTIKKIIYKKTITLFELSFVLGWLFGGGSVKDLEKVKKTAFHFGLAFQIADDLGDLVQDEKKQRKVNFARLVGKERAFSTFEEEMHAYEASLRHLHLETASFKRINLMLWNLARNNFAQHKMVREKG